jgi:LysM repeat protein
MATDRYKYNNNITTDINGNSVYTSILYPKIAESPDDIYIITKETDRLDALAYKYYKDTTMWWVIAQANGIKGTFNVEPNNQIRIPMDLTTVYKDVNKLNG